MRILSEILGFTTLASIIWNAAAYFALVIIIIGVYKERCRNILFTVGAGILALYAGLFLHNQLFATLQILIVISGIFSIAKLFKRSAMLTMIILTIAAYVFLASSGAIASGWALIGSFGLLGIAFGLMILPKDYGFLLMSIGGILLIIYAFTAEAWIFLILNVFFTITNLSRFEKTI